MTKKILSLALMIVMTISLVGCGSAGSSNYNDSASYPGSSMSASDGGAYAPAPEYDRDYGMMETPVYSPDDSGGSLAANTSSKPTDGLKIIYTADLSIQTKEWENSMSRLTELIELHNGYIQNSRISGGYTSTSGYYRDFSAYLSVRVPSSGYRAFLADAESVGTIIDMNEYTDDITAIYIDTEARINSLKLQEERLLDLLSRADDLTALIEIESKLADVRYMIESNQSIMNTYNNLLSYSTITFALNEVSDIVIPKDTFGERVVAALIGSANAVLKFFDGFIVAFIYLAPFLIIALVIIFVIRRITRKKRLERKAIRESLRNSPQNIDPSQHGYANVQMPNPYIQQQLPETPEPPPNEQ